jgi:hypothetical protein
MAGTQGTAAGPIIRANRTDTKDYDEVVVTIPTGCTSVDVYGGASLAAAQAYDPTADSASALATGKDDSDMPLFITHGAATRYYVAFGYTGSVWTIASNIVEVGA